MSWGMNDGELERIDEPNEEDWKIFNETKPLSRQDKIAVLEAHGWHQYYTNTHYVHTSICDFFDATGRYYYGREYTNYQMTVDEAYELYLTCQKPQEGK